MMARRSSSFQGMRGPLISTWSMPKLLDPPHLRLVGVRGTAEAELGGVGTLLHGPNHRFLRASPARTMRRDFAALPAPAAGVRAPTTERAATAAPCLMNALRCCFMAICSPAFNAVAAHWQFIFLAIFFACPGLGIRVHPRPSVVKNRLNLDGGERGVSAG